MHVQKYCFANLNLMLFCRSHYRRRRRCLSSPLLWSRNFGTMVTWRHTSPLYWGYPSAESQFCPNWKVSVNVDKGVACVQTPRSPQEKLYMREGGSSVHRLPYYIQLFRDMFISRFGCAHISRSCENFIFWIILIWRFWVQQFTFHRQCYLTCLWIK